MNQHEPTHPGELPSLSTSLLDRVQQMQPTAWARLVEVFSPIVYRWARQSGLSGADSADVVQDVFVAVARNVVSFERKKDQASFRSWLATITRNRVRDRFRKHQKNPPAIGGTANLQQFQNLATSPDANLENSISLASLDRRLPVEILKIVKADCDPVTWDAFWLTTVMGDSAADVADRLEMNVASVYQAKSRVLRRLRKRMDELP